MNELILYSYWRSSAAYRVRIALNLKQLEYTTAPVDLVRNGGEQKAADYKSLNPQQLVPVLCHGRRVMNQSLAIIEYLDEVFPDPALLPVTARERARTRALAQIVACDIHPLNNLRLQHFLETQFKVESADRTRWMLHWMTDGFAAFETLLASGTSTGTFCEGEKPTIADICLVPQVYNAQRYRLDMTPYPIIQRINAECLELSAFSDAAPDVQPDAEPTAGDQ